MVMIYKLKDILKNGTNIGRKEQLPVVGPAHPWSRSILHPKPKGSQNSKTRYNKVVAKP